MPRPFMVRSAITCYLTLTTKQIII